MFNKVLIRLLILLPFVGLTPCIAYGVELAYGFSSAELIVETEGNEKYDLNWVLEEFEGENEDNLHKFSLKQHGGNGLLNLISPSGTRIPQILHHRLPAFWEISFLKFPSIYIANCVYRL